MAWEEDESIEYTLDANSNRTKETDTYNNNVYVTDYFYDMTKLMSNYAHPFKDKTGLDYITDDIPHYNKIESYSSDDSRTTYNYNSQIVLGVNDTKVVDNEIKVLLNQRTSDITIKSSRSAINNVEIYSITGSNVFKTKESKFNIATLNTGVYIVNVTTEEGVIVTKKIIKN